MKHLTLILESIADKLVSNQSIIEKANTPTLDKLFANKETITKHVKVDKSESLHSQYYSKLFNGGEYSKISEAMAEAIVKNIEVTEADLVLKCDFIQLKADGCGELTDSIVRDYITQEQIEKALADAQEIYRGFQSKHDFVPTVDGGLVVIRNKPLLTPVLVDPLEIIGNYEEFQPTGNGSWFVKKVARIITEQIEKQGINNVKAWLHSGCYLPKNDEVNSANLASNKLKQKTLVVSDNVYAIAMAKLGGLDIEIINSEYFENNNYTLDIVKKVDFSKYEHVILTVSDGDDYSLTMSTEEKVEAIERIDAKIKSIIEYLKLNHHNDIALAIVLDRCMQTSTATVADVDSLPVMITAPMVFAEVVSGSETPRRFNENVGDGTPELTVSDILFLIENTKF